MELAGCSFMFVLPWCPSLYHDQGHEQAMVASPGQKPTERPVWMKGAGPAGPGP